MASGKTEKPCGGGGRGGLSVTIARRDERTGAGGGTGNVKPDGASTDEETTDWGTPADARSTGGRTIGWLWFDATSTGAADTSCITG